MRLTIEVHDARVDAEGIGNVWSEIIEVTFRSRSGDLEVREWGGEPVHAFEALLLPPGGGASGSTPEVATRATPHRGRNSSSRSRST